MPCTVLTSGRPDDGKYPPAEPGALRIGPLEAATLNPKLCLLGRRTKYTLPTSPRPFIVTPENRCLLRIGSSLDGVEVSRLSIVKLHFVCVVAHDLRFRRWATAVNVKLILPPRPSGGSPGYARMASAHAKRARSRDWPKQKTSSERLANLREGRRPLMNAQMSGFER